MKRPIKFNYLTNNQFTYNEELNMYYKDLEEYVKDLEDEIDWYRQQMSGGDY